MSWNQTPRGPQSYHRFRGGPIRMALRWLAAVFRFLFPGLFARRGDLESSAPRRTPPPPRWLRSGGQKAIVLMVGAVLVGAPAFIVRSGWFDEGVDAVRDGALALTGMMGLEVDQVLVNGRTETDKQEILNVLRVERGTPIFGVDLDESKRLLETLNWVAQAEVERRLPDQIFVTIYERRPVAIWQYAGKHALIDQTGAEITRTGLERFTFLPLLVGMDAPAHVHEFFAMLSAHPEFEDRVKAGIRVGGRRWDLQLNNGVNVQLPENGVEKALDHLARIDAKHDVLSRELESVDLRLTDRIVVRAAKGREIEYAGHTVTETQEARR